MATRTISNAGGNWNATGTWVEGIVPTASDDIVATATSGNLTMNVSASCRSVNFTNYVGTLNVLNNLTIASATTNTFVNTMTITGTARIRFTVATTTLITNGLYMPVVDFTATTNLSGTLNCGNFFSTTNNVTGADIICNGNVSTGNVMNHSGYRLRLIGTQSHTISLSNYNGHLELNGSGTFSFVDNSSVNTGVSLQPGSPIGSTFSYINGNIVNPAIRISNNTTGTVTLDVGSYSNGWDSVFVKISQFGDTNVILSSDLAYRNLTIMNDYITGIANTTKRNLNFTGPGVLAATASGETFILPSFRGQNTLSAWYTIGQNIRLQSGLTYSLGSLYSYGLDNNMTPSSDGNNLFFSSTPGTKAGINVVGTQSITFTDFTDISASQSVYTLLGQTSNVTNITSIDRYYYTAGGGGVSGGSWTFVQ
jgi:hypothetical protein